jgi:hypothetical protein
LDKTIVTAFLVIAGVVSAVFFFNSLYPAIVQSSEAMTGMERRIDERMKSEIEVIHATRAGGEALVWVKNVGSVRIAPPDAVDVFFGPEGNFTRIPYGSGTPHWTYSVENATEWTPTATLRVTISGYTFGGAGTRYFVKVVLPSGVSDETFFSE